MLKNYIGDVDLTNYKYLRIDFGDEKQGPGLLDQSFQIELYLKIAYELGLILILPIRTLPAHHNSGKKIPMKFSDYYDINCIKLDGNSVKVIERGRGLKSKEVLELSALKRTPPYTISQVNKQLNYLVEFTECKQDVKFAKKFVEENKIEGCVHIRRTDRCKTGHIALGISPKDWETATRFENVLAVLNSTNAPRNIYIMTDMPSDDPIIKKMKKNTKYNFMFLYDFPKLVSVKKQNNYKIFNMESCIFKTAKYTKDKISVVEFYLKTKKLYDITLSHDKKYVWFRVPKVGSRTILQLLNKNNAIGEGFPLYEKKDSGYNREYDRNWDSYFKFTFVRNPFDRLVSAYYDKVVNKHDIPFYDKFRNLSFKEFVLKLREVDLEKTNDVGMMCTDKHIVPQVSIIPTGCECFVAKFENLQEDFNTICDKIGIPHQKLPHKNKTKHKHYTEYYDDETKQIVAEIYAKDIEQFGYEFGK